MPTKLPPWQIRILGVLVLASIFAQRLTRLKSEEGQLVSPPPLLLDRTAGVAVDLPWRLSANSSNAHPSNDLRALVNLDAVASDAAASPAQPPEPSQPDQLNGPATPQLRVNASQEEHRAAAAPLSQPAKPPPAERSHYLKWILKDLSYWKQRGGITLQLVDAADQAFANGCGGRVRLQVVGGRVFVSHAPPGDQGWYPAQYGRGWVSGKGRAGYIVLAVIDVLHHFPGEIPDVDIVVNTGDFPCMRKWKWRKEAAPPAFTYSSNRMYYDIPFPDHTYYGHEIDILNDAEGHWLYGWDAQLDFLLQRWPQPLKEREPQLVWRGRYWEGARDRLRKRFVECQGKLNELGNKRAADKFNIWKEQGHVDLSTSCRFRYVGYLESKAWSTSFHQKMACGSVFVTPRLEYYEFYTREMQPGRHYVEVTSGVRMCQDIADKILAMEDFVNDSTAAGVVEQHKGEDANATIPAVEQRRRALLAMGKGLPQRGPQAQHLHRHGQRLLQHRRQPQQQHGGPSPGQQQHVRGMAEQPAAHGDKSAYPWGSHTPQEIADAGRKFMHDHVRMRDVRLYLRDVLREYGALMTYKPQPLPGAICYSGKKLIDAFGIPYKEDGEDVAGQYPWLVGWGADSCP